jgi:hypothetical protein
MKVLQWSRPLIHAREKSFSRRVFFASEFCQRMIPKSGRRFSDKIMRNQSAMPRTPPRADLRQMKSGSGSAGCITIGCGKTVGWVSGESRVTHRIVQQAERNDGKKKKRKQNAGRRSFQPPQLPLRRCPTLTLPRGRGREWEGAARLPAFHCGSRQGDSRRPRLSVRPCFLGLGRGVRSGTAAQPGAEILRVYTGVTRAGKRRTCPSLAKHLARRS